jgi:hypothetical protein
MGYAIDADLGGKHYETNSIVYLARVSILHSDTVDLMATVFNLITFNNY